LLARQCLVPASMDDLDAGVVVIRAPKSHVHDGLLGAASQVLQQGVGLLELRGKDVPVVWIAGETPGSDHQRLALADALDLGRMQRLKLVLVVALLRAMHSARSVESPGGTSLQALTEPDVSLSSHKALAFQFLHHRTDRKEGKTMAFKRHCLETFGHVGLVDRVEDEWRRCELDDQFGQAAQVGAGRIAQEGHLGRWPGRNDETSAGLHRLPSRTLRASHGRGSASRSGRGSTAVAATDGDRR
jgi:hypothetical protein